MRLFPYGPEIKWGPQQSWRRAKGEESMIGLVAEVCHVGCTQVG